MLNAANAEAFAQPHWRVIAAGFDTERWFADNQAVGTGGIANSIFSDEERAIVVRSADRVNVDIRVSEDGVQASAHMSVDDMKALRKALKDYYPQIAKFHLSDYKVRILDTHMATAATTRVLIDFSDGIDTWSTVGASANIIEASWQALVDSIQYKLSKDHLNKNNPA